MNALPLRHEPTQLCGQVLWLVTLMTSLSLVLGAKGEGCQFPLFLQTHGSSWGDWMCKSDTRNTTHAIRVEGHEYRICTIPNNGDIYREETARSVCGTGQSVRRCVQDYGNDMYGVLYENEKTFQCVQFLPRSKTVVQLAVDAAKDGWRNCSSESGIEANFTLDEYPWISVNHFRTTQVTCPFTGGFNFRRYAFSNKYHYEEVLCDAIDPPIRTESDCVVNDGIRFNFRHHQCLKKPSMNAISVSQRFLCMASWKVDGDRFAILRNPNNDRHFYCLRLKMNKRKVVELVLFLDWTCYRRTDLASKQLRLPINTPYLTFSQAFVMNVTFPCSDEQNKCSKVKKDCIGQQCMRTCDQCVVNEGLKCHFPSDLIGRWETPGINRTKRHLQVNTSTMTHPVLGKLECVSFTGRRVANTWAVLWGNYQNGCYPRFLCMHYDNPTTSVMRYRLGDVIAWPLTLKDEEICDASNFRSPPDIESSLGFYKVKPWNVALRNQSTIARMPCVLPSNIPDHSGFVDQDGRSGCISFRSKYAPFTISVTYSNGKPSPKRGYRLESGDLRFSCIAALTYTSIMTLTDDDEKTALCWMVIDDVKLVVIKTSACNEETARGILNGEKPYQQHLKFWFDLGGEESDLHETCNDFYTSQEEEWMLEFWRSQGPVKDGSSRGHMTLVVWFDFRFGLNALHYSLILMWLSPLLTSILFTIPY